MILRLAMVLPLFAACAPLATAPRATMEGQRFPDVPVVTLDGSATRIVEGARGRVTVVDLWATWCQACKKEHDVLERLAASYDTERLWIVGVSVGEDADTVRRYVDRHPFSYPVFLDEAFRLTDTLGETALPAAFVVGTDGRILKRTAKLDRATLSLVRSELSRPASESAAPE